MQSPSRHEFRLMTIALRVLRMLRHLFIVFILLISSVSLHAQTDHVITIANGDVEGLIAALHMANTDPAVDTVALAADGVYVLTQAADAADGANGLPSITGSVTIQGNGASVIRSAEADDFRILHVAEGGSLMLDKITLRGGHVVGEGVAHFGGAILNRGTLTLHQSTLAENEAEGFGGAIENRGDLEIYHSTLSENHALSHGGAINNSRLGTLTVTNGTFAHNHSEQSGGAIKNNVMTSLFNTTFSANIAGLEGGAISNGGGINNRDEAPLAVLNTTFYDNDSPIGSTIFGTGIITFKNTLIVSSSAEQACVNQLSITAESGTTILYEAMIETLGTNYASDDSCPGFTVLAGADSSG